MSYKYGSKSRAVLETCCPEIQDIMQEVIKIIDCSPLEGYRDEAKQTNAFNEKRSKVQFPNSKHNTNPSLALDVVPYPIDWNNIPRFAQLGGIIKGVALMKGYKIRCGFDWDMDGEITDNKFMDWPHFEYLGRL